ncbi:MAG: adenylyltransferase/cytidyltransferase family protein [Halobacteriales archaeon]
MPTRVLAQGTFDILHPGHVQYLEAANGMGDDLYVVVARRENVTHKPAPILPNRQRRDMVGALGMVDHARIGHPEDIFVPVREIDPDVIALGFDQHHDEAAIADRLDAEGIDCEVRRAPRREPAYDGELLSTGEIIERIIEERA